MEEVAIHSICSAFVGSEAVAGFSRLAIYGASWCVTTTAAPIAASHVSLRRLVVAANPVSFRNLLVVTLLVGAMRMAVLANWGL